MTLYVELSVADPDPGSGDFLTYESGIRDGKKSRDKIQDPGSRMNIPNLIFENLVKYT
jgi:hypothetical protein